MKKPFTTTAIFLFGLMALLHSMRLFLSWEITIADVMIPMWASALGAILTALLAVMIQRESSASR